MRLQRLPLLGAALVVASVLSTAAPAFACSISEPPDVADLKPGMLVDGHPDAGVVGVYEFQYLARSPRLLISGPRAVTIVTRYWGEPPAHVGLEMTGSDAGILGGSSNCGDMTQPAGTVAYWYADQMSVDREDWGRPWLTLGGTDGPIDTVQEAMLEERFGPPVVLDIGFAAKATATFQLWKWHLLAVALITSLFLVARAWIAKRRER